MCGICGILCRDGRTADENLLREMTGLMVHRGPDDDGYYFSSQPSGSGCQAGLGMRRLKIIDLETGHQPVYNEDRSIWIICNGETYNYRELRKELKSRHRFYTKTDVEVILHLYEEYGTDCLRYMRGMFAFAIWDSRKGRLFLARDRLGQKPLYYMTMGENLYFASEIKCFLKVPGFEKEIDLSAIHDYLTYQFIPSPKTIWKNVYALRPASFMLADGNGISGPVDYWDLDFTKKTDLSFEESKDRLRYLLEESTRLRMISDVPLGAFLSGGHDSTVIVGLMSKLSSSPVKTFSIGFREDEFSELKYARIVSERFKTEHNEFIIDPRYTEMLPKIVWHYDQPYADCSALPSYYVAMVTRKHVTVALNGDGGDENFAGYLKYRAMKLSQVLSPFFRVLPKNAVKSVMGLLPMNESKRARGSLRYIHRFVNALADAPAVRNIVWRAYFTKDLKESIYSDMMKTGPVKDTSYESQIELFNSVKADNNIDRMLYSDILTYLPDDLLVKMDIACMANSLEGRSPFLDHHVMEFTSSLPPGWKLKGLKSKYILKEAFREYFPDEIIGRKKQGFSIPLGKWFKTELKDYLYDVVLSDRALGRGYFSRAGLEALLESHMEGNRDYGFCLWALLMLELWHREFADA
ncbi:MAG: asparagine synthase (glutamine-hydrolyzing) [Elusimicrobia bacterium]|nr:asparagine synthase (glutamine-hydrolyzing) [Elusimicrobiota bacterium]